MADYSVSTIAELLLLDERRIQQLSKEGVLGKKSRGKYDLVDCVQGYIRYLRDQAKGKDPETVEETKKIAKENRRLKELARKEKEGRLVDAEEVSRELTEHIAAAKTRLRSIPAKSAQEVAHLKLAKKKDRELIAEVQSILMKQIDEVLEDLSEWKPTKS